MLIKIKKGWEIRENKVTPEEIYLNRRIFLKRMGLMGVGALYSVNNVLMLNGCSTDDKLLPEGGDVLPEFVPDEKIHNYDPGTLDLYQADRISKYTATLPLTDEEAAATYNNFYEFNVNKERVWQLTGKFQTFPWSLEVSGLVNHPQIFDIDKLIRLFNLEERLYRFRCVEAWAMKVPWTGFPLKKLIDYVEPLGSAKYVQFVSFFDSDVAPGQNDTRYEWPYYEGLTMDEAVNELTLMVTGIYGHPLPKQHGAPIRLIIPWKYGYKSIKSIVKIEFTDTPPATFWSDLYPDRYPFTSNVNPSDGLQPWSQANERLIDTSEIVATQMFNGYGEYVADLYP